MSSEIRLIRNVGQGSKDAWAVVSAETFRVRGLDPADFAQQCITEEDVVRVRISPTSYLYLEKLPSAEGVDQVVRAVPFAEVNARPRIWTTDLALLNGARTVQEVRVWQRENGLRSQAKSVGHLRVPELGARATSVFFDGTDGEVRQHLEDVFGSDAFYLVGDEIVLELPLIDVHKRPRSTGETVHVRVRAPTDWSIQAPEGGSWWHVVPDGSETTLCTIPLTSWTTPTRRDDDHAITCPWCRARMIAIEIVAPPGARTETASQATRPTLHEEIAAILAEREGWMTTTELANVVNTRGRYRKRDGTPVTPFQIHGRTRNYPQLFERAGSRIRLRAP